MTATGGLPKPRRIMHIDLDAFFVSVEQALNPSLKGKPVVVGGRPEGRGVVAAASYEARAFGIRSGMPLATARRLCPKAIFLEGRFDRYLEASKKFMAILADFSPCLEPAGLDEAYLDATGFESLYGTIGDMGQRIRDRIRKEIGVTASIGISGAKAVSKVASKAAKPDGLLDIEPGREAQFLAPLPIGRLPGIGKKTEKVLHGLGVRTMGQLAALPVDTLKRRFGVYGEVLKLHARGIDDSAVMPPAAAKSISNETTFEQDTRDMEFLEGTLSYLSEKVGSRLRRCGRKAGVVVLKLRYSDFTTISRQRTVAPPTDADHVIFEQGLALLKQALSSQRQPVRLIGIGVGNFTGPEYQLAIGQLSDAHYERLYRAVDSIRQKYGFSAIQTGRSLALSELRGQEHNREP